MANTGDFRENGWIYRDNCLEQVGVVACAVASKKSEECGTELQEDLRNCG